MSANNARGNSRVKNIQDPSVSSTVHIPRQTFIKPRITNLRHDVGWFPIDTNTPLNVSSSAEELSTSKALIIVAIIFVSSLLALGFLYSQFPHLEEHESQHLHLPWDLEDAKHLGLVLDRYKDKYFYEVLFGVFLVYIFLQTFAIPGSIFLSILSGCVSPPSFVAIQAGQTLHTLTSTSDAWSWTSITVLTIFAFVSLIPVFLKDKLREKFD
ncbi:unnamed protein product [Arctia plantaginis]|uniref:Uncharacterized protein n=1 Tax=Arctia plantaginis TaxID=874455 RepID=A0A8S0ZSM4_ARCPL|nr:unnamed protein product [Arctia plantaginis]